MSIWILPPQHSGILSHFMHFHFLLYVTCEKNLFHHRHQSSISFLCCVLPSPLLLALLPHSSCPWFLSSSSLSLLFLLVLSFHPSCQTVWSAWLGKRLETGATLFRGFCQVGTPTQASFISLTMVLAAALPPFHLGLHTQLIHQRSGELMYHTIWRA